MIDIQLILHNLEEAREELRKSLKRRKEIFIAKNDTQYKEIDSVGNENGVTERGGVNQLPQKLFPQVP